MSEAKNLKAVECKDCGKSFVPEIGQEWWEWCPSCTASINRFQEAQQEQWNAVHNEW